MFFRWLIPILALAQIVAGRAHELLGWGRSISERSAALDTVLTPAGYAFSIWGVIYVGCLALAAYQALPAGQERRDLQCLRPFLAAALLTNTLWPLYVQAVGLDLVSVVLIFATLGLLLAGWYRWESDGPAKSRKDAWLIGFPLSLFAGWVSAAAFVNLSATSKFYGFTGGLGEIGLGCVLLTLCAVVALTICRTMLHVTFYAAAVLWAMVGILAAAPPVWVGLTAALIAIAVLTSFSGRESRNREFTTSGKDSRLRVG